jgi:U5 small nuclear ribonucleoprotein component
LKVLASPLEKGISDTVEKELVDIEDKKEIKSMLEKNYDWDFLAASNVWAFGPEPTGSNIFVNDTFVENVDQTQLSKVKPSIIHGFKWSTREGPLCDEPMRNVKFKVTDCLLSPNPIDYPPGQLIPTARRAFYSAFLLAKPRLMEPVYMTEI